MAIINLRDYYPFYTSDCFMEVSEEVAEMFKEFDRKEAAYRLRTYRHKAYYSLDRDDGLEHEAVFVALSPHEWYRQLFERLDNSKFRSSFHLKQKDIDYINEKGLDTIRQHAKDFIAKREAPAYIANDGKQTPMRGHPVFIAQHATATCCRECIRKWHKMQPGKELSQVQQDYLVDVIMTWIQKEIEREEHNI